MDYSRQLKRGMSGADVRYMKDKLFKMGYYSDSIKKISSNSFGADTVKAVKAFQAANKDVDGKPLSVDGIIGPKTWQAIEREYDIKNEVNFTRNLKQGMSGADVRYIKDMLFKLGWYTPNITKISSNSFGADTVKAVKAFQQAHGLTVNGIIGKATWDAIVDDYSGKSQTEDKGLLDEYTHISEAKRKLIEKDLEGVSELRKEIVLEILKYAYDYGTSKKVRALYIFGANLYNTNLTLNIATNAGVEKSYKAHPSYFSGGRKEWMLEMIKEDPNMPASDCSGMEIGYMREHKLVKPTTDATANGLCGSTYSTVITRDQLKPGDWVGKDGHIGTYVGGGFVVEFYGGAYGCQLTNVDNRVGYDFVNKVRKAGKPWTKFRRPKAY